MMKLRKTSERSPTSMIIEPPHNLNGSEADGPLRWRHMKYVSECLLQGADLLILYT